jgi:hypothetical protein
MVEHPDRRYGIKKPETGGLNAQSVHPEDMGIIATLCSLPQHTLYECLSQEGEYIRVRRTSDEAPYRLLAATLQPVPDPKYTLGEKVSAIVFNPPEEVVIYRIEWHVVRNHEVYYVMRSSKLSHRRYLPEELHPIHPPE